MKFTCTKRDLRDLLKSLSAVSGKSVFQHNWVLIEASVKSGGVRFRTFNHTMMFCSILRDAVTIEKHGRIKCYIPILSQIVEKLKVSSSENVTILKDKTGYVQIYSGNARFEIGTQDPKGYPSMREVDILHEVEVQCEPFKKMVSRVAGIEDSKKQIPHVMVSVGGSKMSAISTDSLRMAIDSIDILSDMEGSFKIPHLSLRVLALISNSRSGTMHVGWGEDSIRMRYEDTVIIVGKSSGGFPPWSQMFESLSKNQITAKLQTTEFRSVIESFGCLYDEENFCPLTLSFSNGSLKASMTNKGQGMGAGHWDIGCEYTGEDFTIYLNSKYMTHIMRGLLGSELIIRMRDQKTPVYIEFEKDESEERTTTCENLKYVLCPIDPDLMKSHQKGSAP